MWCSEDDCVLRVRCMVSVGVWHEDDSVVWRGWDVCGVLLEAVVHQPMCCLASLL